MSCFSTMFKVFFYNVTFPCTNVPFAPKFRKYRIVLGNTKRKKFHF